MQGPSGLKSATWLWPLRRGHGHLVKLARHTLAVCQRWKDSTSIWMGPLSMEALWLEGYQIEQRRFKGHLCWSFICKSYSQKQSNWKGVAAFQVVKLPFWKNLRHKVVDTPFFQTKHMKRSKTMIATFHYLMRFLTCLWAEAPIQGQSLCQHFNTWLS